MVRLANDAWPSQWPCRVTDAVADALVEKLVPKIEALKIGPSLEAGMEMGPLVTGEHLQKVTSYIDKGVEEGAKLVVDGRGFKKPQGHEDGFFIGGSLFDHATPEMTIAKEEIFGPVLTMIRRNSYQDAVDLIHGHEYANGVSIFTRDGDVARTFNQDIEVGMVGVNVPIPVPMAFYSFGGWKASLFGDHHMHGMEGVRFYTPHENHHQPLANGRARRRAILYANAWIATQTAVPDNDMVMGTASARCA